MKEVLMINGLPGNRTHYFMSSLYYQWKSNLNISNQIYWLHIHEWIKGTQVWGDKKVLKGKIFIRIYSAYILSKCIMQLTQQRFYHDNYYSLLGEKDTVSSWWTRLCCGNTPPYAPLLCIKQRVLTCSHCIRWPTLCSFLGPWDGRASTMWNTASSHNRKKRGFWVACTDSS